MAFDGGPRPEWSPPEEPWWSPYDSAVHAIANDVARRVMALAMLTAWGALSWSLLEPPITAMLAK